MLIINITKKQQELVLLLYRFRFLNRAQFQTLLNHKTFNRIIVWLNDLTVKGYIEKIVDTESKIQTVPTVYRISKKGIQFLNTKPECEKKYIARMYKDWDKSEGFAKQCLFIVDIYVSLRKIYGSSSEFSFYTPSNYGVSSIIKEISPHFVYRRGKRFYTGEFLVAKPRKAVRLTMDRYIEFYSKGNGKDKASSTQCFFICPNIDIEEYAVKYVSRRYTEEGIDSMKFHTAIFEQVQKEGMKSGIWSTV